MATVEAYQNCRYDVRAAYATSTQNTLHLLAVLSDRLGNRAVHEAMFGDITWATVGDWAHVESVLAELCTCTAPAIR